MRLKIKQTIAKDMSLARTLHSTLKAEIFKMAKTFGKF